MDEYSELLWLLFGVALLVWFFFDSLQARERAITLSRQACDSAGVQFLDETVALVRLGVRRSEGGVVWRRIYRFEYLDDSCPYERRDSGFIVLRGQVLEDLHVKLQAVS